jgi:hypothetical protein
MTNPTINPKLNRLNAAKKRMEDKGLSQDLTLSSQLAELNEAGKDSGISIRIDVSAIKKAFNPRLIPLPLEIISTIQWPSLNTPLDDIKNMINSLLKDISFFSEKNDDDKDDALDFFCGIHTLAQSLQEDSQLQNIITYRLSPTDTSFVLIAGERRVIACLYAGIRFVNSRVYNSKPSPLKISRIVDSENSAKSLKAYERVISKKGIWDALDNNVLKLTNADLQVVFGMNSTYCSWLKQIFTHKEHDFIMNKIVTLRMGWRDIQNLLEEKETVLTVKTNEKALIVGDTEKKPSAKIAAHMVSITKIKPEPSLKKQKEGVVSFGINVNRNTNLCFFREAIELFEQSNKITSPTKDVLSVLDKSDYKQMVKAINAICNDLHE